MSSKKKSGSFSKKKSGSFSNKNNNQSPKQQKRETPEKSNNQQENESTTSANNFGILPLHQSQEKKGRVFSEVKDLDETKDNQNVLVRVRVENSRLQGKNLCFLTLRQGAFSIQGVLFQSNDISSEMLNFAASITKESIVEIEGIVTKTKDKIESTSQQTVEIQVKKLFIFATAISPLPLLIQDASRPEHILKEQDKELATISAEIEKVEEAIKAKSTPELKKELEALIKKKSEATKYAKVDRATRLDNRVLDLRVQAHNAIFRIQSGVTNLFRETLLQENFIEIHSPKIISGASEGGAQVFPVDYFNQKACMAQSPQLYKQMALSSDFERVFEVGPVFRAEPSDTHRHLTEFIGLDFEMAFYEHYHEVLDMIDKLFYSIFEGINKNFAKELEIIQKQYAFEPLKYKYPCVRLAYPEAVKILRGLNNNIGDFDDLNTQQERLLGGYVKEKYGTDFFILDKFPLSVRPFYSMPDPQDPKYANAYDVFLRGEEIMSGAQRVHDPELLIERAKERGVNPETIKDYVNAFRYGMYPHAGGGIGLERVVMLFLGLSDIRQTSLFPRDLYRLTP